MLANNMNEASTSSTASTSDSHANTVECQKTTTTTQTHKESSPPNIFNNSSSLKYLHKKFKRVASAVIEENCDKVKTNTNANLSSTEISSKYDAASLLLASKATATTTALSHNGETTIKTPANAVQLSHINESETNSQDFDAVAELMRNAAKRHGPDVLCRMPQSEFSKHNVGATDSTRIQTTTTIHASHKQYENDLIDSLSKCKDNNSTRLIGTPLQQQKTNKHYENDTTMPAAMAAVTMAPISKDFRTKVIQLSTAATATDTNAPQNFKENLNKSVQIHFSGSAENMRIPQYASGSSVPSTSNKSFVRRKTSERPYPCVTCGSEFKTRSQYYKHCRYVLDTIFYQSIPNLMNSKCFAE